MNEKKNYGKKTMALMMVLMLLVGGIVGGTVAFLISETDPVVNTFAVGNVKITLDEATVNQYGELLDEEDNVTDSVLDSPRTKENTYKLIPGHHYYKDPTIHVKAGSEPCWLFVKITNGIDAIEAKTAEHKGIIAQMEAAGWELIDAGKGIYGLPNVCKPAADIDANIVVFNGFTIADDANVADYEAKKITIIAYAVQADGFDSAAAAWAATFGAPANP